MPELGRIPNPPDPRDDAFSFALVLDPLLTTITLPASKTWANRKVLDQGNQPACVGFTGAGWMANKPVVSPNVTNQLGLDLYRACKAIDGIPNVDGTYDRALMKVLTARGRVKRYLWATTPDDIRNWVLGVGPVMVGTNWYSAMFAPNDLGYVVIGGPVAGGHEYLIRGYDAGRHAYRCRNSWGTEWGRMNGDFWIKEKDLYRLVFDENGDACTAEEAPLT